MNCICKDEDCLHINESACPHCGCSNQTQGDKGSVLEDVRVRLLAAASDAAPCIFRTSCEFDDLPICRCAKAAADLEELLNE